MSIRTRFAPSPTGELHVGGARTALFNYLLAKQNNGQFIMRVEDTDRQRSREKFIKEQYEDLIWLGIKPDESVFQPGDYGPYQQSQRLTIYQKYIEKLLNEKKAYYCFCSPEELAQEKVEYIKKNQKSNYQYSRKCLKLGKEEIKIFCQKKKKYVVRCYVPDDKNYELSDLVRGKIVFSGLDIEDFVLCRGNGMPLLNFAVVIDDYGMKISHVLRGEEHLSNTAKQLVLYELLGWNPPLFGHISIILNKEKKKLSKRDKEISQWQLISQLREKGYLSVAIVNYLLLLGWHPGSSTQEVFSLSEAKNEFRLEGLKASGAVYDLEKLNWYNNYYIQKLEEKEFAEYTWQFLSPKYNLNTEKKEWVKQISLLFRPQLNYFQELIDLTNYFFQSPKKKANRKSQVEDHKVFGLNESGKKEVIWLKELNQELNKIIKWEIAEIKLVLETVSRNSQAAKKEFYSLLRKTLTGREKGPELPKIILLLGKEEVKKRID
jgi:nondiscriminating glutamyl-tRNA synthetase